MLCSSAQIFDLLCAILCSCKRFVLKNFAVLLEYIHLHHKNFNVVANCSIYILHTIYSCTNRAQNNGLSKVIFRPILVYDRPNPIWSVIFCRTFPMEKPLIVYNKVPILNK